jgi:hypothetical protein
MGNKSNFYKLGLVSLLATSLYSCKPKVNAIDNNSVITKPFAMLFGNAEGVIWKTNNANAQPLEIVHGSDGEATRALGWSGNNIIFVKRNAFVGQLGGNFNVITPVEVSQTAFDQSMFMNLPEEKRVYMAGNIGKGIIYSDTNGKARTWVEDKSFANSVTGNVNVTSFARTRDKALWAFDNVNKRLFKKPNINEAWTEVTMSGLPAAGNFFITSLQNSLIAADRNGSGVWIGSNQGQTWTKLDGLPATGLEIYSIHSPFDQFLLVGTNQGMYRLPLNSKTFSTSNVGLDGDTRAFGITSKKDIYKNDAVKEYVFAATSSGLYKSEDFGQNWVKVMGGYFVSIY